MTKDKLIRFLNNRCTEEELQEVIRWANTEVFSAESKGWVLSDWNTYREERNIEDDEKFGSVFDKIQKKIAVENIKRQKQKGRKQMLVSWLTRAAAILLLPVMAFLFYTLSEIAEIRAGASQSASAFLSVDSLEIIAPIGSRAVVQLSDGSVVHLNYGSRLKYPQTFTGNTREVVLDGEGYFDVAHNPEKPFIVKAGELNVKALGTAFNVSVYSDSNAIETTLVNGKVVLERNGSEQSSKVIGCMIPGQHVSYNVKTGIMLSSKGSVEKYIAWKDGKLIFDETAIADVAEKLGRMFNVDIEVEDDIKDYTYTVTFEDEPLFQILDLMTVATPVKYNAMARTKLPDGTFSKQKIVLRRK
ncbi:FecR family protein [Mariniphaga anaerophila]|uniref:FecR family protein n=1 Tax=Mariniphaga anaerophila TaxID=1484053 RepID=A0A1M5FSG1_9BACT|nr:FecR family protein [Mariniphaga anaerophila]SHF94455.1 FecR family protein [Mariniphaga anaerophila]